jgi:Mrp family chromosome partitioning ATPase
MQRPPRPQQQQPNAGTEIKHVVAVMSGKGGVGKSLVTGLLAVALRREGFAVGILDGDITGPSIPRMFGLPPGAMRQTRENEPPYSRGGIAIMSMNVLLEEEDQPAVLRGPMVAGAIKQFYSDIAWGALDYLLVDLPPGTSDAPMTVLQSLPVDGTVIVSTPQQLSTMVVRKAIHMCEKLDTPVIGLVENMAFIELPGGARHEPFGPSQGAALVALSGAPLLAQLPLDQRISRLCDEGMIEAYDSTAFQELSANFMKVVKGATRSALPLRIR